MSQPGNPNTLEHEWQKQIGQPLEVALKQILCWQKEGDATATRAIGYLELVARAERHLEFDGKGYRCAPALAELIAEQAQTLKAAVYPDLETETPVRTDEFLGSTIAYDLACQIAKQNKKVNYPVPQCLEPFAELPSNELKRPRTRGDDAETRILRDRLSSWAIQRGIELGLKASRNREPSVRNAHSNKISCATDLVVQAFANAGWRGFTFDMALAAHTALHYSGTTNSRRASKRSNRHAIHAQFAHLDELIPKLGWQKD